MKKILVIGGGPAGMIASYMASETAEVTLIEKNEKLGKKLYITGKGRCNLTNLCEPQDFLKNIVNGERFIKGAIYRFTPEYIKDFFEESGLPLKVERGNRVFPESDKASDVTKTLEKLLKKRNIDIRLNESVTALKEYEGHFTVTTNKGRYFIDAVIVCTGGLSYPTTGSTGDGYQFAKLHGHTIVEPVQSLVGFKGENFAEVSGLSLKNVTLSVYIDGIKKYSEFGEMLFTHHGISGPIVITLSAYINRIEKSRLKLYLDLKPALTYEQLDLRLLRDFSENKNKNLLSVIYGLMPRSLAPIFLKKAQLSAEKKINEITKEERKRIIETLKNMPLMFNGLEPIENAIVTSGGVSTLEINPQTMESKKLKGLYFAGEVIDVDALTGGFSIQIALSTGIIAGLSASKD